MKKVCSYGACLALFLFLPAWLRAGTDNRGKLPEYDWGFIASRDTTLDGNSRVRAMGPFFERQAGTNGMKCVGVRPFYSRYENAGDDRVLSEFLWPVAMSKQREKERFWRVLTMFGDNFDSTTPDSRHQTLIIPFVFYGNDANGERYFAVFPIGGRINEFLGQDKITFALWPLYCHSSVMDKQTHDVLWPFISWSHSPERSEFRIMPFYAKSFRRDEWTKTSVMWPIWNAAEYTYPDEKGSGYILFPLLGHTKLTDQESWMVVPPLFRWSRSKELTELHCPWPFISYSSGQTDRLYFWPIWGKKRIKGTKSWFMALNLIGGQEIDRTDHIVNRFMIFPLIYNESKRMKDQKSEAGGQNSVLTEAHGTGGVTTTTGAAQSATGTGKDFAHYFKFWPLVSYEREHNVARWRMLDMWPTKGMSSIERNYTPLWTIYAHTSVDDAREDEFLWGLFRWQRGGGTSYVSLFPLFSTAKAGSGDGDVRRWDILKGLFGYERDGLRKTYRLLYLIKL